MAGDVAVQVALLSLYKGVVTKFLLRSQLFNIAVRGSSEIRVFSDVHLYLKARYPHLCEHFPQCSHTFSALLALRCNSRIKGFNRGEHSFAYLVQLLQLSDLICEFFFCSIFSSRHLRRVYANSTNSLSAVYSKVMSYCEMF